MTTPPRWARALAWATFAVTVPSAVWRVLMILGLLPGTAELRTYELGADPTMGYAYVFGLSIVQLTCGFLTVGLVRPWSSRFLGRRVSAVPVILVGLAGGLAVTWLFDVAMLSGLLAGRRPDQGLVDGWALVLMVACYLPIMAWGPFELASVAAYARRRFTEGRQRAAVA